MPVVKILAFMHETIGAGLWQPVDRRDDFRRELDADRNVFLPVRIVGTLAGPAIEQLAVKPREIEFAGVLVLEFDEAAFGAAVAERFPFLGSHLGQRLGFPEGRGRHGQWVSRGVRQGQSARARLRTCHFRFISLMTHHGLLYKTHMGLALAIAPSDNAADS